MAASGGRGGFAGWRVLAVAALAVFLSGPGQTFGVSVFLDPLLAETGWSRSLVSTIYSLATLISAGVLLIIGRQIDRLGHRVVLVGATIGFGCALFLTSSAQAPIVLLTGFALLRTCGSGVLTLAARTLVPQWFVRRRGRAFSVLGVAGALSLAAIPPFGEALIRWTDWRTAWRIEAFIIVAILVPLVVIFVQDRPEDIGQLPDGETQIDRESAMLEGLGVADGDSWTLQQARRLRAFWLLLGAGVVPALVITGLSFNQVSIFTERGLPAGLAATTFAVESLVSLPTTVLSGWLSDRVPLRFVLAGSQAFLAAAVICLLFADSPAMAVVYAAVRGVSTGLWSVAADVAWPSYFGRRHLGSIRGLTFAAGVAGAAIGPLPLGFAYDVFGRYEVALIGLLILPIGAVGAVLFAKPPGPPPVVSSSN